MHTNVSGTTVTLELTGGNIVETSFVSGSVEQGIVRKALCRVKRGMKIGIRKLDDPKTPIIVEKFYNKRTSRLTLYVDVVTGERLEKLREPGKPLRTGVVKALDIVERQRNHRCSR